MFESVIGHNNIKERLEASIKENRVSHAYLFCGKKGIGKTTLALEFARQITNSSIADVKIITNETYPIKTERKTDALSVEAVREMRKDAVTKPYLADKKVFIIPNAHLMNHPAQNALLKIFEEPPSFTVIILIGETEDKLLPTIRSRASIVRFAPLSDSLIEKYLTDKYQAKNNIFVKLAAGSIGSIDEIMQDEGLSCVLDEFIQSYRCLFSNDMESIYHTIAIFEREKKRCMPLFNVILCGMSDSLLCNNKEHDIMMFDKITKRSVLKIIDYVHKAINSLSSNANYSIVVSELIINTWEAIHD